jgi:hypothetical protein
MRLRQDFEMAYLELFERVVAHVAGKGVAVTCDRGASLTATVIDGFVRQSPLGVPQSLIEFYSEVGDGLLFQWSRDDVRPFCLMEFPTLARLVANAIRAVNRQVEWHDSYQFPFTNDPELAKATAQRMRKWLAFQWEGNGDRLCVDTGSPGAPVVFDKHDWFDGGSGDNGHLLGNSLLEFCTAWSDVCFQHPESLWWPSVFKRPNGVTWDSDQFREPFRLPLEHQNRYRRRDGPAELAPR